MVTPDEIRKSLHAQSTLLRLKLAVCLFFLFASFSLLIYTNGYLSPKSFDVLLPICVFTAAFMTIGLVAYTYSLLDNRFQLTKLSEEEIVRFHPILNEANKEYSIALNELNLAPIQADLKELTRDR